MRYWIAVGAAWVVATVLSWTPLSTAIDDSAYDWMSRLYTVSRPAPQALIVAIDETTLQQQGGMRSLRTVLAKVLDALAAAPPVVAIDFTLADAGDPAEDALLAAAMARIPHLVLATDIAQDGSGWQDPQPAFARTAEALGHVHADPDPVSRRIPLEKAVGRTRRWAMAFEAAYPQWAKTLRESTDAIELSTSNGPLVVPGTRESGRAVAVRFSETTRIVSASQLLNQPGTALPSGVQAVFIGTTAMTAARDRLMTPLGRMLTGVEIHAQLFETLREGRFRVETSPALVLLAGLSLMVLVGFAFQQRGWRAYLMGLPIIVFAHAIPHIEFQQDRIFPTFGPILTAWLVGVTAATFQYFGQRRQLVRAQSEKARYQEAIHWVTHEMRTPLTAIQGSSELMTRYKLPEEKQRQIADMINAESKRLAQMIQTFLNVERLSGGEMQLKREPVSMTRLVDNCVGRARSLAERKQQRLIAETASGTASGDGELLEFALYNLVTNAIKYSPEGTEVRVTLEARDGELAVSVRDQGMGISASDIKKLGTKFFRTDQAEKSGIAGTGIGLSIVREIITRHGGHLEVTSALGEGSCFTMVVPASVTEGVER